MGVMDQLEWIGLTERESKAYLALLELGSTTTGPLIKKSGVPNSKIYEVLDGLHNKGLASYIIKGKIKYFQAAEPKRILQMFRMKEKAIEQELVPLLEAKQTLNTTKQSVEMYDGFPAIRGLFIELMNQARKGEEWYGYSPGEGYSEEVDEFYKWLGKSKHERGIKDKLIISKRNREKFMERFKKSFEGTEGKILRFHDIFFPGDVGIFRDNVVLLNWGNITAIRITSKSLAGQFRKFHNEVHGVSEGVS